MNHFELQKNWNVSCPKNGEQASVSIPAEVPGFVHLDLLKAEMIPDMFWRDQANECQWVENQSWLYQIDFDLPQRFSAEQPFLHFEGLDTYAEIRLNGNLLGEMDNMFHPWEFDVSKFLKPNEL